MSLKGGVGKSTLTEVYANHLHQYEDVNVLVVDCDNAQQSLMDDRKFDLETGIIEIDKKGNEIRKEIDPDDLYQLVSMDPVDFPKVYLEQIEGLVDVTMVDIPGSMSHNGVTEIVRLMDYIFIPLDVTSKDFNSMVKFIEFYNKSIKEKREKLGLEVNIYGVFNKIAENITEFKEREAIIEAAEIPFLESYLPFNRVTFQRNSGTVNAFKYSTDKDYIVNFTDEIDSIIGLKK